MVFCDEDKVGVGGRRDHRLLGFQPRIDQRLVLSVFGHIIISFISIMKENHIWPITILM